jgi:hypothetical protein
MEFSPETMYDERYTYRSSEELRKLKKDRYLYG